MWSKIDLFCISGATNLFFFVACKLTYYLTTNDRYVEHLYVNMDCFLEYLKYLKLVLIFVNEALSKKKKLSKPDEQYCVVPDLHQLSP